MAKERYTLTKKNIVTGYKTKFKTFSRIDGLLNAFFNEIHTSLFIAGMTEKTQGRAIMHEVVQAEKEFKAGIRHGKTIQIGDFDIIIKKL